MLSWTIKRTTSKLAPGFLSDMRMLSESVFEGKHVYQFQEDKSVDKEKMTEFHIHRFLPEDSESPAFVQSYWVDLTQCGPMVLDVLVKIKNEIDPTLTFRR